MVELSDGGRPTVSVELKYVRNLGNYESIHVLIGVSDSARKTESVSQATDRVYTFVENKLIEKMKEIEAELKG
jgi:hypothetical protein